LPGGDRAKCRTAKTLRQIQFLARTPPICDLKKKPPHEWPGSKFDGPSGTEALVFQTPERRG
jgi:hypothetical protein